MAGPRPKPPVFGPSYKKKSCLSGPSGPQGLKLPDVLAAEIKDGIWKELAVGVTCELASASDIGSLSAGTMGWQCLFPSPPAFFCVVWESRGCPPVAPAAPGFGVLQLIC